MVEMAMGQKNCYWVERYFSTTLKESLMEIGISNPWVDNQRLATARRRENPRIGRECVGNNAIDQDPGAIEFDHLSALPPSRYADASTGEPVWRSRESIGSVLTTANPLPGPRAKEPRCQMD
jgi:hypothetical protein